MKNSEEDYVGLYAGNKSSVFGECIVYIYPGICLEKGRASKTWVQM